MENSTTDFYFTAKKIGHVAVKSGSECTTELELQRDTDKHLFSVLHLGSFYYFIFNFFHDSVCTYRLNNVQIFFYSV